ncbi:MAG: septal ring lytic transglycosylase RlpA family protein [Janthinobacterium lividum]
MAHARPPLALAVAITLGSGISTAGAVAFAAAAQAAYQVEMHAAVTPLAPAPNPPKMPSFAFIKHPHLPRLRARPLAGLASWYGSVWNGRKTASGEDFDESQLTAAHKSLPLGTLVRVTNLRSMRSVIVRINDRGALAPNRIIDLSSAAAREIGMMEKGLEQVSLEVLHKT